MQGIMQDWPLRVSAIIDHAARYHGQRRIVGRSVEGPIVADRLNAKIAMMSRSRDGWWTDNNGGSMPPIRHSLLALRLRVPIRRPEPIVHFLLKRLHDLLRFWEDALILRFGDPNGKRRSHANQGLAMLWLVRFGPVVDLMGIVDGIEQLLRRDGR